MSVLINFKICDNAKECLGIEACTTGALSWSEKNKTIVIDNSKCISCGKCEEACDVHAIRVAKTEEEYKKIKREIDKDSRKVSDLFIDRYGAQPIHPAFLIGQEKFNLEVLESAKLTVLELFDYDLLECLLNSISIRELFKDVDIKYRKMEARDKALLKKYNVKKLPALLFFRAGELIAKIEGFYGIKHKKRLKDRIEKLNKFF